MVVSSGAFWQDQVLLFTGDRKTEEIMEGCHYCHDSTPCVTKYGGFLELESMIRMLEIGS